VGYRELLQALEEEVGRQIRERRAETSRERGRLLETTRMELLARREQVLEEERRRLAAESVRALARARLEQDRAILGEMRRQMAQLRREAEARLPTLNDPDLLIRLVDEVVPELGEGSVVFRVREGYEQHLETHLGRKHPGLLTRSTIEGSSDFRGGVEVLLAGRQRLDDTLPSRLLNAWQQLEPELAVMLFQTEGAAAHPSAPASDESVGAAQLQGRGDDAL
jgi:vacuolar-type H+-ATPase subunit E/Vma4